MPSANQTPHPLRSGPNAAVDRTATANAPINVAAADRAATDLAAGDVIGCWSPDSLGRLITWATASPLGPARLRLPPSHVAIIIEHDGEPMWVESTTLCPHTCTLTETRRRGVQMHPPGLRLEDYCRIGGRVERFMLAPIQRFSDSESALLTQIVTRHLIGEARRYDLLGAALSGWRLGRRLQRLIGADLDALFCSELVAALLMRVGRMNHADPALFSPGRLLRQLVQTGVYRPAGSLICDHNVTAI